MVEGNISPIQATQSVHMPPNSSSMSIDQLKLPEALSQAVELPTLRENVELLHSHVSHHSDVAQTLKNVAQYLSSVDRSSQDAPLKSVKFIEAATQSLPPIQEGE